MPKASFSLKLLRTLFRFIWSIRALRPAMRRFWPVMRLQVGGHTMLLHPADNYTERFMWRMGVRHEAASIGRLTLLVTGKRALIFDIGANCGAFTLPLATAAGSGSRIVAFEPNPVMAHRLRRNLSLNGLTEKVELAEVAVGATDGEAALHLGERNLGQSSLRSVKSVRSIPVTVRPLARYLPEQGHRYETFVIKIDVEGYEDEVLVPFLTATPTERMPDAILIETHSADLWCADLTGLLKQQGYVPFFEGEDQNTLFLRVHGAAKLGRINRDTEAQGYGDRGLSDPSQEFGD